MDGSAGGGGLESFSSYSSIITRLSGLESALKSTDAQRSEAEEKRQHSAAQLEVDMAHLRDQMTAAHQLLQDLSHRKDAAANTSVTLEELHRYDQARGERGATPLSIPSCLLPHSPPTVVVALLCCCVCQADGASRIRGIVLQCGGCSSSSSR